MVYNDYVSAFVLMEMAAPTEAPGWGLRRDCRKAGSCSNERHLLMFTSYSLYIIIYIDYTFSTRFTIHFRQDLLYIFDQIVIITIGNTYTYDFVYKIIHKKICLLMYYSYICTINLKCVLWLRTSIKNA